ncbi:hypothetical protein ONE63_009160 [Megalurothrips usitatus]|uniref:Uncharacterized protein n=1 Tax=Megalurothrips usitatus TaxID=439358 RepID=A0AAV7XM56_9NEOP|nr:hypothetical protein ONE63_009160 [Megalurothrips usitatus]
MRAYIDRVKEFEQKTILASEEYDTGKRFLANIMGEDPSLFSNEDVDKAVQYLLPSGIYQEFCRPEMKPPQDIVQKAKFDDTGRPYHFMFYTNAPKLYELQHDIVKRINKADKLLEALHRKGHMPEKEHQVELVTSEWVDRIALSTILNERIGDAHFDRTMIALNHLANHPMSNYFKDFIMTYRKPVVVHLTEMSFPEVSSLILHFS